MHFFGIAYQGKDIVFRLIIECSGLRDVDPKAVSLFHIKIMFEDYNLSIQFF